MTDEARTAEARAVRTEIDKVATNVTSARTMVAEGQILRLDGLEAAVADLCASIGKLPAESQKDCKPGLVKLIDEFDKLSDALRRQQAELGTALKGVSQRKRAATAYGTAPGGKATDGRQQP